MHDCPECGLSHEPPVTEAAPAPVIVEDAGPNENDVKIAEIEAEARVETEKLWTDARALELESEVGELKGELRGIRETLDRIAPPEPEPEPEPVVVPMPTAPAPEPEAAAPLPETGPKTEKKKSGGYWG